jgi:hypothetical protein
MLENYKHKYHSRGKFIFAPTERCDRKGEQLIAFFGKKCSFPDYFYHYMPGGHVAALHRHVEHEFFFKIDIQNFFYSIARNRVIRALRSWGLKRADNYGKWSCVASPYPNGPSYVLPIGFKQSPLLASLVLMQSPVSAAIERARANGVAISVYLDDFIGSHNNEEMLTKAYDNICNTCVEAHLTPNEKKLVSPSKAIVAFNCNLSKGSTRVTDPRIDKFFSLPRTEHAIQSFKDYVARVENKDMVAMYEMT